MSSKPPGTTCGTNFCIFLWCKVTLTLGHTCFCRRLPHMIICHTHMSVVSHQNKMQLSCHQVFVKLLFSFNSAAELRSVKDLSSACRRPRSEELYRTMYSAKSRRLILQSPIETLLLRRLLISIQFINIKKRRKYDKNALGRVHTHFI